MNPEPIKIIQGVSREDRWMNPGLLKIEGGWLMAVRHGWDGCEIRLAVLNENFHVLRMGPPLWLDHPACRCAQEDPRLFWFGGAVHMSFSGVQAVGKCIENVNMLIARLSPAGEVEDVWHLDCVEFNHWEKNHVYFECDGRLYGIYSGMPHRVYEVTERGVGAWHETRQALPWKPGTPIRGGSPPIRMGDEYWHFFHSKYQPFNHKPRYVTGLYTFETKPPFRILRITPTPFMEGDEATNIPGSNLPDVVFVCGGQVVGDTVYLSSGEHDYRTRIDAFKIAEIERLLVPVQCAQTQSIDNRPPLPSGSATGQAPALSA